MFVFGVFRLEILHCTRNFRQSCVTENVQRNKYLVRPMQLVSYFVDLTTKLPKPAISASGFPYHRFDYVQARSVNRHGQNCGSSHNFLLVQIADVCKSLLQNELI